MSSAHRRTTGGVRTGGRSERVVREVLRAAAVELARSGYETLRIEDIAARAGVNKTTIYRRWPTKAELIGAMVRSMREDDATPDTGTIVGDLREMLRSLVAQVSTPEGYGVTRVLLAEIQHPEVEALMRTLRDERSVSWRDVLKRAVKRGEVPRGTDPQLLSEMIFGPVLHRLFRLREPMDDAYLASIVDIVVLGIKHGGQKLSRR